MKDKIYEKYSIQRLILTFSIPAILSLMIEILTSVVDTIFAGHIGPHSMSALSAMGVISPVLGVFTALQTLFAMSTAVLIAKYLTQLNKRNEYFTIGFVMTCVVAVMSSLIFLLFMDPILIQLGATGDFFLFCKQYLLVQLISNIFSSIGYTLSGCIRAFGYPKVEAVIINITSNAILVFGCSLELLGIAFGTLLSEVACAFLSFLWIVRKGLLFRMHRITAKEWWKRSCFCSACANATSVCYDTVRHLITVFVRKIEPIRTGLWNFSYNPNSGYVIYWGCNYTIKK